MKKRYGFALVGVAMTLGLAGGAAVLASDPDARLALNDALASSGLVSLAGAQELEVLPLETAKAKLTEMGYEVLSLELDDDEYEGYAMRDGLRWEVELDATIGQLLEAEYEADDEDDHDDDRAGTL